MFVGTSGCDIVRGPKEGDRIHTNPKGVEYLLSVARIQRPARTAPSVRVVNLSKTTKYRLAHKQAQIEGTPTNKRVPPSQSSHEPKMGTKSQHRIVANIRVKTPQPKDPTTRVVSINKAKQAKGIAGVLKIPKSKPILERSSGNQNSYQNRGRTLANSTSTPIPTILPTSL